MSEPIVLYVDYLREDGKIGQTTTPELRLYNLKAISTELSDEFSKSISEYEIASFIIPVGRFICTYTVSIKEKRTYEMLFCDLGDDKITALMMASRFDNIEFQNRFMDAFRKAKVNRANCDMFIIVKGEPSQDK